MNLLESILNAAGGGAVKELAKNFNLGENQAQDVIKQLAPAIARGLQKNTQSANGLDNLLNALKNGNHERYAEDPSTLTREDAVADGNGILGHLFGSKDVSRQLATRAAEQTGVSDSLIKKMLPLVAGLAMGSLSKQGVQNQLGANAPQAGGLLNSFLDADKDGSVLDDVLGMAGKFFGR